MLPSKKRLRDLIRFDEERPGGLSPLFALGMALVLLLLMRPLYFDLGGFDLENDEAIYSHAALSIVKEGAWASPWSSPGSSPFLEKPPLKFWLVALGLLAGLPPDELGMRFFDPLFGGLALLYLYALGWRAGGFWAGLGAAFGLFLFEPLLFEHGLRANTTDAALVLAYCGGAWHLLAWARQTAGSWASRRHLLACTLFFTFGFLVKFVAALFLPLVAAVAVLLDPALRRRLLQEYGLFFAAGGLFLLLAAPWFVWQHLAYGDYFWRIILGQHVVERFTHHLDPGHLHPFTYYFAMIHGELAQVGTLPWVLLGLAAWLVATWRSRSFFGIFVLLWVLLPLFAISFGTSKLVHYSYPFLPPLGLFAGFALSRLVAIGAAAFAEQRSRLAGLAVLALTFLLISFGGRQPFESYGRQLARFRHGPHLLRDFATCLGRGGARTLVDDGRSRPLVFVHAFLTDGVYHPMAFYSRQGGELQQLDMPDDRLAFFRLYLPPHQAAVVMPDLLWQSLQENLRDESFRQSLLEAARELGGEAEVARLLAGALPTPPGFDIAGTHYFLPGPYAECAPPP